jgi:hypothetical protein
VWPCTTIGPTNTAVFRGDKLTKFAAWRSFLLSEADRPWWGGVLADAPDPKNPATVLLTYGASKSECFRRNFETDRAFSGDGSSFGPADCWIAALAAGSLDRPQQHLITRERYELLGEPTIFSPGHSTGYPGPFVPRRGRVAKRLGS